MDKREEKKRLREELRQKTRGLSAEYVKESNEGIAKRLLAMPQWQSAQTLFIYVSVGNEPATRALIDEALAQGKRVCVPRCQKGGVMEVRHIEGHHQLAPATFGLLEPDETAPEVPPEEMDLVVAPCVAADKDCMRLGNGGGYYDRYLSRVRCPVVCLCREALLQDSLPVEDFDLNVGMVLTEERLLQKGENGHADV